MSTKEQVTYKNQSKYHGPIFLVTWHRNPLQLPLARKSERANEVILLLLLRKGRGTYQKTLTGSFVFAGDIESTPRKRKNNKALTGSPTPCGAHLTSSPPLVPASSPSQLPPIPQALSNHHKPVASQRHILDSLTATPMML
jgi:hypothetical protein